MKQKLYIYKSKSILMTSVALLLISVAFASNEALNLNTLNITSINIKELKMATASIKVGQVSNKKLIEANTNKEEKKDIGEIKNVSNPISNRTIYLPTEYGVVTTYPSYYHMAYDITSPRGSSEVVYPIANGIISGIYTDSAGALIVTVRHIINGRYYSSQYVHLARYANIYVGEEVSPFTPLGWMGTTGNSTGVHLHIAVLDCNLFGNTDICGDLNGFFRYGKARYNEGFRGLSNLINVPSSWNSR